MSPAACRWPRTSGHPELVGSHHHAGLTAHDLHKHPDPSLRGDCLNPSYEVRKGTGGQAYPISGPQKLRWKKLARGVAAQHQLADDIERHWRRFPPEAHQPRDPMRRVDRTPVTRACVDLHENISGKQWLRRCDELSPHPLRTSLRWQEGPKPLQLQIAISNVRAVRLQLRQKPAHTSFLKRHRDSPLITERMPSIRAARQVLFRAGLCLKAAPACILAKKAEKILEPRVVVLDAHTIWGKQSSARNAAQGP